MLTLCIPSHVLANATTQLSPSYKIQLEYLTDPSLQDTIHQARRSTAWQQTKKRSFGFQEAAYWFHFTLPKSTQIEHVLEIRYPFLNHIGLYIFQNNELLQRFHAGQEYPFAKRPILHRHFAFPLTLSPTTETHVYFRVKNNGIMQIPLKLWSTPAFQKSKQIDNILQGFFIGAMLIIVFYSLILFISIGYIEYFHYFIHICCFSCLLLITSGLGFQFIWPKHAEPSNTLLIIFLMLASLSACLLKMAYLKRQKQLTHALSTWLSMLITFSVVVMMLVFLLPYVVNLIIAVGLLLIVTLSLLCIGIQLTNKHDTSIYYYTIFWLLFLLLIIYEVSSKLGFIPLSNIDHLLLQLTGLLEAGILIFLLKLHIQSEQSKRSATEETLSTMQKTQQQVLEKSIQGRTIQLETQVEKLLKDNAELNRINQYDSLTNVFNRHSFNLRYKQLVKQAIQDKEILSMIIVDIDHFKNFNDNYGHHTGDQCLQKVAQTLQSEVHRSQDMLFRYGGEEFVILLPNTISRGSYTIADRMRTAIENIHFMVEGKRVPITISGGVASLYLHQEEDAHTLFNFADTALYEAKNSGRNRVNIFTL
ncbi:MAG: diguanylate cyclase [Mariprofundaceae bacterium]|nr:diguanylate cyclase [Mariprofundaceae bacterium]